MPDQIASFLRAFRYRKGSIIAPWRDVSRDAHPTGDCQDFAWSVLILETGSKAKALFALLTGRAMIWRCWSPVNKAVPRHAVLRLGGRWIDSTVREWRDSPTPHKRAWPVGAPVLAIIAALFWASPMRAETVHSWGSQYYGSTISLEPTTTPGAVAQVRFDNKTVHRDEHVTFDLTLDGLTVRVEALVGRGLTPDRMEVIPPDGYLAVPDVLDVAEDDVGVILVVPWVGF